jgi:hypothetical protein
MSKLVLNFTPASGTSLHLSIKMGVRGRVLLLLIISTWLTMFGDATTSTRTDREPTDSIKLLDFSLCLLVTNAIGALKSTQRCPNYKQGGWSMLGDRRVLSSHAGERWVRGRGRSGCRAPLTKRLGAAYVADMPTRFHYCARAPSSCSPSPTINILHIYIRIYVCMYTCIIYVLYMLKCICVYTDTDTATDTATDTCR